MMPSASDAIDSLRPLSGTAVVAEDEPLLAMALESDLKRLWPELKVLKHCANGDDALRTILQLQPDVAFLDIRMPGLTGIEVAMALVEDWPDDADRPPPLPVFVTAYDEFAPKAFEAAAVDYLVKPLTTQRLAKTIDRLKNLIRQRQALSVGSSKDAIGLMSRAGDGAQSLQDEALEGLKGLVHQLARSMASVAADDRLASKQADAQLGRVDLDAPLRFLKAGVGESVILIPIDEIVYLQSADKYLRVMTESSEYLIRESLRELLPRLDPARFKQIHRGTIVHLDHVKAARRDELGYWVLSLKTRPETLRVSRLYADWFRAM